MSWPAMAGMAPRLRPSVPWQLAQLAAMSRLIQDTIRKALADELLFGKLTNGGRVTIDIGSDDKIRLDFDEAKEVEPVA